LIFYLQSVSFRKPDNGRKTNLSAGPSHFTTELLSPVIAQAALVKPFQSCSDIVNPYEIVGKIAIIERGECTFVDKARRAMKAGALAVIIFDNVPDTSINNQPPFAMSGDDKDDKVKIPTCFLFTNEAIQLRNALNLNISLEVSFVFCKHKT
jgi:ER degradation enhancer, mannosidase alpha-like 3